MTTSAPNLNDDFENAADEAATPHDRAYTLIGMFLATAMENYFDVDFVDIELEQDLETGEFQLGMELLPDANEQDQVNFGKMKFAIIETLEVIQYEIENGTRPYVDIRINQYALEGYTTHMFALKDYVTLLTAFSDLRDLHWEDAKHCSDMGYAVSLADLHQAIALIPEDTEVAFEEERETAAYDRPVDTGLPKVWLQ